tara:strand:+ start:379 stop:738 length:360 start_codon:yes stop_codon:yes gene_type:complete
MSKWNALPGKNSPLTTTHGGLFAPVSDSYKVKEQALHAIDATDKVSKAIQQTFNMCNRLPKQPVFRTDGTEIEIEEGVLGAMGEVAADLLDLTQTQDLTASPGLGLSGNNNRHEDENEE